MRDVRFGFVKSTLPENRQSDGKEHVYREITVRRLEPKCAAEPFLLRQVVVEQVHEYPVEQEAHEHMVGHNRPCALADPPLEFIGQHISGDTVAHFLPEHTTGSSCQQRGNQTAVVVHPHHHIMRAAETQYNEPQHEACYQCPPAVPSCQERLNIQGVTPAEMDKEQSQRDMQRQYDPIWMRERGAIQSGYRDASVYDERRPLGKALERQVKQTVHEQAHIEHSNEPCARIKLILMPTEKRLDEEIVKCPYFLRRRQETGHFTPVKDRHYTGIHDVPSQQGQSEAFGFSPCRAPVIPGRKIMKQIAADEKKQRHMKTIKREIRL